MTRQTRIFLVLRSMGANGAWARADRLLHMPLCCPHAPLTYAPIRGVPRDTIGGLLLVIGITLFSLQKARDQ